MTLNGVLITFYALLSVLLASITQVSYAQERKIDPAALTSVILLILDDDGGSNNSAPSAEPSVSFLGLVDNQTIEFGQALAVEAGVNNATQTISQVELFVDNELVRAERVAPYQWGARQAQDPRLFNLTIGVHSLRLVVTEADGNRYDTSIGVRVIDSSQLPSNVSLVVEQATAFERSREPASYTLSRTGAVSPLSVDFELGAGGGQVEDQAREQDYDLVYADSGESVVGTLNFLQGQTQRIIEVRPRPDDRFETVQRLSITLNEGIGYTVQTPQEQSIIILDARNTPENEQTFVGVFTPLEGVSTQAMGLLSLVVQGDNRQAVLNYNFQNLSSRQQDQFLDIAPSGNTFSNLPRGAVVDDFVWSIAPGSFFTSSQEVLDALFAGNFFVRILSDDFPEGEIRASIERTTGVGGVEIPEEDLTQAQVDRDIIRFLNQSTFGATPESYNELRALIAPDGQNRIQVYGDWIDEQFDMTPTNMTDLMIGISANDRLGIATRFERIHTYWTLAINSPDQLRHRLAQSLSEILVISDDVNPILNAYLGLTTYWDILASSGNGSYKELLEQVTRHTSMGTYLSHLQNQKENVALGIFPDENYAREIMQLFSFGLVHLNKDGSFLLDENNALVPTYDNDVISEMARVFTGLSLSRVVVRDTDTDVENTNFNASDRNSSGNQAQWTHPMRFFPEFHDFGEKTLFQDKGEPVVVEANGSSIAAADQELEQVISAVVAHSSTAPRISRLLIQQLVTSNPSGAYVERVAGAFGESGDMRAMIKAILLDQEARNPNVINVDSFGKQKSPLFQLTSFMRMTDVSSEFYLDGRNNDINFVNFERFDRDATFLRVGAFSTAHENLAALSVFNFYSPDYTPPGEIASRSLVAPEMELLTETSLFDTINDFFLLIDRGTIDNGARADDYNLNRDQQNVDINRARLNEIYDSAVGDERAKAAALVDYLDFYYNASQIALTSDVSGTRDFIIDAVVASDGEARLDLALYGVANAPESLVQK